jgi:carbon starvation protein
MNELANKIGEKTLFGRVGGAPTLAVGMANIFSQVTQGRWLDLWYHFAIMFEALFILTTLDAGTRVGRYLLQDFLGHAWKPLGDTRSLRANVLASVLTVSGWGYFLIQGVRDPLGGINSLWPLFGIANQMLAAIALCLATTIILKMQLARNQTAAAPGDLKSEITNFKSKGQPALALITLIPLAWLLSVTMTAGVQKIFHSDPRIGFIAGAKAYVGKISEAYPATGLAKDDASLAAAQKVLPMNKHLLINNIVDAIVAGVFLIFVTAIVVVSVWEWILLLARRKPAVLRESEPVWLPDYAVAEGGRGFTGVAGTAALAFALAKELSGEAQLERAQKQVCECDTHSEKSVEKIYVETTEQRFNGMRRCC